MLGRKLGGLAGAFALFATALVAVLGGSAQPAVAVDPVGTVTNFPLTNIPAPAIIVTGPDGNLWFADQQLRAVVRLTPGGELTTFPAGFVQHVISGGDGNLWLVRVDPVTGSGLQISRMTTAGVITSSFSDPAFSTVDGIAYGPDGNIWFTNSFADIVGRLTPSGTVTTFADATIINPNGITAGPDGALWFTNGGQPAPLEAPDDSIGRITTAGAVTSFPDPQLRSPSRIVSGPDGALWFANNTGGLGRVTTSGAFSYYTFTSAAGDMFVRDVTFDASGAPWFIASFGEIGVLRPNGSIELFAGSQPSIVASPTSITRGLDGAIWFTQYRSIGRITSTGALTFIGDNALQPHGITTDAAGNIWFTNEESTTVSRRNASGEIDTFFTDLANPRAITRGPDGRIYYTARGSSFFVGNQLVWEGGGVGRFTTTGTNSILTSTARGPGGVATGPDGNVWYTTSAGGSTTEPPPPAPGSIVRRSTSGTAETAFPVTVGDPGAITAGPDGNLWFTIDTDQIGRITPAGTLATFQHPSMAINDEAGIVAGRDGNLWFTNGHNDTIGRITPSGVVTSFTHPTIADPTGIALGPDDNIWFTNTGSDSIGRITAAGVVTNYTGPGIDQPTGITAAGDGGMWFTNKGNNSLGRIQALLPNAATMTFPANGTAVNGFTYLAANAGAGVNVVEFRATGGPLNDAVISAGTLTAYGWFGIWATSSLPQGNYQVVAVGTDGNGNRGRSAPITIVVDHTPPTAQMLVPDPGATLRGTAVLDASASDNVGVASVEFRLNGNGQTNRLVGTGTLTYYGWIATWNTASVADGTYNLKARATDLAGIVGASAPITIRVDN